MDFDLYGFEGLLRVYNVHPVFVHFPVALFPTALLFFALGLALERSSLLVAARATLYLAAAGAAAAVVTGLLAQDSFPHNERIHHMMETHQHTGYAILGLGVLLSAWTFWRAEQRPRASALFLVVMGFATYLVLQNGDIGSRMVYVQGAAVKPAVPIVTQGEGHEHDEDHAALEHHH